ncbi:probable MaoC family protein, partial [Thalassiosira pseudonana CCMP1335]
MGKYFEDLEPGLKIRHFLTRTVTEADNVFFTCLTLNPAPIHLDHEFGDANSGKPLFNSMFTLALLVGMSVPEATHGTTVANLGFSEVLFPKPVYPGDTLRAETEVLDRRKSRSRPAQGIVTMQHVAFNQRGEVVCKATRQALMKKRG